MPANSIRHLGLSAHAAGRIALLLVIGLALALRLYRLDSPLLWCDEAESSINALTILQHGYPTDTYLGLPIYENCLTEPWPESPEYEFRDSSYSKRGVAVYHGWLPLYSIAGSLKLFGVKPDVDDGTLHARQSDQEIRQRTFAARFPAVLFGIAFLLLLFETAREMYGRDAAWAALLPAAVAVPIIKVARTARYYSLTTALCTACCLFAWRMYSRRRSRDFVLGGVCFGLLFHTNALTFLIACLALATLLPAMILQSRRRDESLPTLISKLALFGAIVLVLIGPWVVLSGFLEAAANVPKARDMLSFPRDLLLYPIDRWPVTLVLTLGTAWVIATHTLGKRLPARVADPFREHRGAFYFLAGWGLIGFIAFVLLIPAASLFFQRAYLGVLGPGIVFGAMLFAAGARVVGRRISLPIAGALFTVFVLANVRTQFPWVDDHPWHQGTHDMIQEMRHWNLRPGTRLYATPNDNLTLTYYTGLPIQSITPVRREFLLNYPGDIVLIETIPRLLHVTPKLFQVYARDEGIELSTEQAEWWALAMSRYGVAHYLQSHVAQVDVDAPASPLTERVLGAQLEITREQTAGPDRPEGVNPAIFRGFDMPDYSWWWQIFSYRFVDPLSRSGENLNYWPRMKNAELNVTPSLWVVYRSPGQSPTPKPTMLRVNQNERTGD